ncbi:MAG: hypothetical protein U1E76_24180 [Planctomycetota bacterium]
MNRAALITLLGAMLAAARGQEGDGAARAREPSGWALDFANEPDVAPGGVAAWAARRGFTAVLGSPVYFFLDQGKLHLVAKPGPIHEQRVRLALTDRERLRSGLESKVLLRLTTAGFVLDVARAPRLKIKMAPVTLPGQGADLRDSKRNDSCFYLLLGFGDPVHDFSGISLPDTLAYVWADQAWDEQVAGDPEYDAFLRYIAIGHGSVDLGKIREIVRDAARDYRLAFPNRSTRGRDGHAAAAIPLLRSVSLMVDANTLETRSESILESIQFLSAD